MAERKPASSPTLPTAIDFDTAELALLISEGVRNVQIRYMRNERRQSASGPTKDLVMGLAPAETPDLRTAQLQYYFDSEMLVASRMTRTVSSG